MIAPGKSLFSLDWTKFIMYTASDWVTGVFRSSWKPSPENSVYRKVPKFWDTRNLCCNLPKIQTKMPNLKVFCLKKMQMKLQTEKTQIKLLLDDMSLHCL